MVAVGIHHRCNAGLDLRHRLLHFSLVSLEQGRPVLLRPQRMGCGLAALVLLFEHIREYQVHLFRDCKLSAGTIEGRTAALRFLFVKTLRRPYLPDHIPFPKRQRRMPTVLSQQEVARLIASAQNLMHRTMLMMLYATGLRRAELCHLKVCDIDSERMVIHVRQGKGGRDRDVLLTPKLLDTLREYWRWMKPKTYLFPGTVNNWRADVPITEKIIWTAVTEAAKRAD